MASSNSSGPEVSRKDADFEKREAEDCISRKEVLRIFREEWDDSVFLKRLNELPPVYPKSDKPGAEWLGIDYDGYADGQPVIELWECSHCGYEHTGDHTTLTNYCPNCGAKMVEPQESEEKQDD